MFLIVVKGSQVIDMAHNARDAIVIARNLVDDYSDTARIYQLKVNNGKLYLELIVTYEETK